MPLNKLSIRPKLPHLESVEDKTPEEAFQNSTLRPIIKMQYDLLVAFFHNHLKKKKVKCESLNAQQKNAIIDNIFKNDVAFKTELRGLIIGYFTVEEYTHYQSMASAINKRIINIIRERLQSLNK